MSRSEAFIFLFVVIIAVFFARLMYPGISGVPSVASAGGQAAQTADAQQALSVPPTLVLPQTAISATAPPDGGVAGMSSIVSGQTSATGTPLPTFTNESYMVADLSTGAILAGSNIDARWPTASLTKLMTASLIFDQLATSTRITITPQMFAADPNEHTLVIGGTYTVEDLLHVMLMPSSNVAAQAMADYLGQAQFINEMNARAEQWGMTNTYFADPSGISAANESSAHDLLILAQHVYRDYPGILALTDTPATTITELNSGRTITVRSINAFVGEPNFIGGKTGNTDQAAGNLLSIFNDGGQPILITVLGAPAIPFKDTSALYSWFQANYQ
ncbi:MAG: serine hydrolase [Minisyncoccia bacterium]|jgi:D-alanyl-D-alanine carboxypeptidase